MPVQTSRPENDAEALARAVETVFRKLIRFLVGRISLVRLQEMIRYIYVEEAERNLKKDYPGKNVPMTKLALVTGLDTRQLVNLRRSLELGDEQYKERILSELTPESAVVEAWNESIRNSSKKTCAEKLTYGSEDSEFETLVRSVIPTRGITVQTIMKRLVDTKSVRQNSKERTLTLIVDNFSPYLSDDEPNIITAAFSAISNLLSTIEHNVTSIEESKFYQRQFWTFRLNPKQRDAFRLATFNMLERYESMARKEMAPYESKKYGPDMLTAGVGFYYFEDKSEELA
jgi:hypothetical protein